MDAKKRIDGIRSKAEIGATADREIDLLSRLLICQAQVESLSACAGYIERELSILNGEIKNIDMGLAELSGESGTSH